MQMILASLYLAPLALWLDRPFNMSMPSLAALGAWLALGVLGTAVAFIVYYRLVETADASYVSMVTYIVPVFGVLLGVLVLQEQLTWNTYAGFGLILLGVMGVNGLFRWRVVRRGRPLQAEFGD
jgi:drug/metabolite transporter (DMT)-like permease